MSFFNMKWDITDTNNIYKFHGVQRMFTRTRAAQTDKPNS